MIEVPLAVDHAPVSGSTGAAGDGASPLKLKASEIQISTSCPVTSTLSK